MLQVLANDVKNVKALYRRGQAHKELGQLRVSYFCLVWLFVACERWKLLTCNAFPASSVFSLLIFVNIKNMQDAVSDLRKALEASPEDETIAEVLRYSLSIVHTKEFRCLQLCSICLCWSSFYLRPFYYQFRFRTLGLFLCYLIISQSLNLKFDLCTCTQGCWGAID